MNWVPADGRKIPITEMGNGHLLNAHRFMEEQHIKIENFLHNASVFAPGEDSIAFDHFEIVLEESYTKCSIALECITKLGSEIKRRGLDPLLPRVKDDKVKIERVRYVVG